MAEAPQDYEDVSVYDLDADQEQQLLLAHNECTFIWANKEGWPVGVIMSYLWHDGRFWLTATSQRARIHAVRRDPRVCIVVSSTGSPMPANKTVTYKGTCTIHEDDETKAWFYPALAERIYGDRGKPERVTEFANMLNSPRRVIIKIEPGLRVGYDGAKMAAATAKARAAGDLSWDD